MTGGIYTGTDLADKTFYGLRLDNQTGSFSIEIINDGVTPVKLPIDGIIDENDYKAYFWSQDAILFEFTQTGHLLMKFL